MSLIVILRLAEKVSPFGFLCAFFILLPLCKPVNVVHEAATTVGVMSISIFNLPFLGKTGQIRVHWDGL